MKTKSLFFIIGLLVLQMIHCASTESTSSAGSNDALVIELNKQLDALEIEGFQPDKIVLADKIYKDWEKKGIPVLKEILPKVPDGYTLKITGHADPYGGLEAANKVAEGRAKHIHEKVTKALGVDSSKISVKTYGAAEYEQEKSLSISKNRRVEFQLYKN